ncbi:Uncharacterised protein [Corynebacterium renale]|nr:Uncharacterised protein [Corynebacterium renale]
MLKAILFGAVGIDDTPVHRRFGLGILYVRYARPDGSADEKGGSCYAEVYFVLTHTGECNVRHFPRKGFTGSTRGPRRR